MSYQDLKIIDFQPAYVHKKICELIKEFETDPEKQQILWEEYLEKYSKDNPFENVRVCRKENV